MRALRTFSSYALCTLPHRPVRISSFFIIFRTVTTIPVPNNTGKQSTTSSTTLENSIYKLEEEVRKKGADIYLVMKYYAKVYSEGHLNDIAHRSNLLPSVLKLLAEAEVNSPDEEMPSSESLLGHFESIKSPGDNCYSVVMWSNVIRGKYDTVMELWQRRNRYGASQPLSGEMPSDTLDVEVALFISYVAPKFLSAKSRKITAEKLQFDPADFAQVFNPSKSAPRRYEVKQTLLGKNLPKDLEKFVVNQALLLERYHLLHDENELVFRLKKFLKNRVTKRVDYMYSLIKNEKLPSCVYACLISGYFKAGHPSKAVAVWIDIIERGIRPDIDVWNSVLDGAAELADQEFLQKTWAKMLRAGVEPNWVSCTTMIKGLFSCRQVDHALSLFQKMYDKSFNIPPTTLTCNVVLKGLINNNRIDHALQVLENAEKAGNQWDIIAYNTVLTALLRKNRLSDITALLKRMEKMGLKPDVATFSTILSGLSRHGLNPTIMHSLFEAMSRAGIEPNIVTFGTLISILVDSNQIPRAEAVFDYMVKSKIKPNFVIATKMIEGYMNKGDSQKALQLFETVRSMNMVPEHGIWHRIIDGYGQHGNAYEMMRYYNQMKAVLPPNRYTYSYILNHLVYMNEISLAESVLKDMKSANYTVDSKGLKDAVMKAMVAGARVRVRFQ